MLASSVVYVNSKLADKLPASVGDCEGLAEVGRDHSDKMLSNNTTQVVNNGNKCIGDGPLVTKNSAAVSLKAKWITGLDTIKVTRMHVVPPDDTQDNNKTGHLWNFEID